MTLWFAGLFGVNLTSCEDVSLGNLTIDNEDYARHAGQLQGYGTGCTMNLLNCTRVNVSDVTIRRGYNMILTAFNGGGGHRFERVTFKPSLRRLNRDAIHFSDQRVGPTIVNSTIGHTGDDLFNIHTTLMLVLRCETDDSCLMVNPHLSGPEARNTVYGTNSVLEMVTPGLDEMSFFTWPSASFQTTRHPGVPLTVSRTERVDDPALLAEAKTLERQLEHPDRGLNPVSMRNDTIVFYTWDLWRVGFETRIPRGVGRATLVQIDTISNAGAVLRGNVFSGACVGLCADTVRRCVRRERAYRCISTDMRSCVGTNCNLGRFKSSDAIIEGNVFRDAAIPSLELSWLPQFFEGPVVLSNVRITGSASAPDPV